MIDIYANKIPVNMRDDVLAVAGRVRANKFSPSFADIEYLFEVYHKYIVPHDEQDIDCRACRSKVCGIFFQIINTWKQIK